MKYIYIHLYTVNAKSFSPVPLGTNLNGSFASKNQSHLFKVINGILPPKVKNGKLEHLPGGWGGE